MNMTIAELYARAHTEQSMRAKARSEPGNMIVSDAKILAPTNVGFSVKGLRLLIENLRLQASPVHSVIANLDARVAKIDDDMIPKRKNASLEDRRFEMKRGILSAAAQVSELIEHGMVSTTEDYSWEDARRCLRVGARLESTRNKDLHEHLMAVLMVAKEVTPVLTGFRMKNVGSWRYLRKAVVKLTKGDIADCSNDYAQQSMVVASNYLAAKKSNGVAVPGLDALPVRAAGKHLYSPIRNPSDDLFEAVSFHGKTYDEAFKPKVDPLPIPKEALGPVKSPPEMKPKPMKLPEMFSGITLATAKLALHRYAAATGAKPGEPVRNALKALSIEAGLPHLLQSAVAVLTPGAWKSVVFGMRELANQERVPLHELLALEKDTSEPDEKGDPRRPIEHPTTNEVKERRRSLLRQQNALLFVLTDINEQLAALEDYDT